jgi:hypothetical protein
MVRAIDRGSRVSTAASPGANPHTASIAALSFGRYDLAVLAGACIYLEVNLFRTPRIPFLLGGDQVFFWMKGQRILLGEHIYRDFFEFTPPGTDLLYLGAFTAFGSRIWIPNLVVLLLGTTLCWLCYRVAALIMERGHAALAAALFLVVLFGESLNGTHHWFSTLAVLGAVAILMQGTAPVRIVIAGILLATATFFTQTRGPVAALGIAAYLTAAGFQANEPWRAMLRRPLLLFGSLVLTWLALSAHYILAVGLQRLWFFQVTYPFHDVVQGWRSSYVAQLLQWLDTRQGAVHLLAFLLMPALYAACLWKCRNASLESSHRSGRVLLLATVGLALFAEIAQSPNWLRMYCIAAPACILTVWMVAEARRLRPYVQLASWAAVIGLAVFQAGWRHMQKSAILDLPAGRVATSPLEAEKLTWLALHTKPGQYLLHAEWPGVYLPLGLRNPLFIDDFEMHGVARLGYVEPSLRQLRDKPVQYILWAPRLELPPGSPAAFREFVVRQYRLVHVFSDRDEVWERGADGVAERQVRAAAE